MIILPGEDIFKGFSYLQSINALEKSLKVDLGIHSGTKNATFLKSNDNLLGTMCAYELNGPMAMIKLIGLFPKNKSNSHQGLIALFDQDLGKFLAIFEASSITSLRTAAICALVTKELSAPNSKELSLIGAGEQAFHQALAISQVRDIKQINIFNRSSPRSIQLKERLLKRLDKDMRINIFDLKSLKHGLKKTDIISIATASKLPLLKYEYLPKKVHINSLGACTPNLLELDKAILKNIKTLVDDKNIAALEAGNFINNLIDINENILELKDIYKTEIHDLKSQEQTLFNSTGLASHDLILAMHLYKEYGNLNKLSLNF